jgi:hypothetical protein
MPSTLALMDANISVPRLGFRSYKPLTAIIAWLWQEDYKWS